MSPVLPIPDFNTRHAIPGVAQVLPGHGGLAKIIITTPAASAEIYLHGAQVVSWQPLGHDEVLFLSEHSHWQDGKAIRGGIPVCFPWFRNLTRAKSDNPQAPSHGTVRTKTWNLESIAESPDGVIVTLTTASDDQSRQWFAHDFRITHRITIAGQLKLELTVENTGLTSFAFEEALHTYNRVGNIDTLRIQGLEGIPYLDNQDGNQEKSNPFSIALTQPTDNAYLDTAHSVAIEDPALHRQIHLEKQHSKTTIVWTPWQQGAAALADLGNDEWQHFACVEAANILSDAIHLDPGQQHTLAATLQVHPE